MIGDIQKDTAVSAYQPSILVKELTSHCKKDFGIGNEILHRPFAELNNRSIVGDMNRGQKTFNAFVDETVENEAEAWKYIGTRAKARNKALQVHAHMTSGYIFPSFLAQNEDDEEDRGFSEAMDDCVEWLGNNSNYKLSFLAAAMGMLVNPVTYMGAEWYDVMQKIKERNTDGSITTKDVQDEILSGFSAPIYSANQILISNAYEQNIQKQRFIFKKRYIEYAEAEAKYGEHENWGHVTAGVKSIYNESDGLFYDVKDENHPNLVAEETPLYRRDDTEVCFLNGVYMGAENVEDNPIRHRDNRGAPKYNVVPFGYQRVNEHFFAYKSLMNGMFWDDRLIDAQYALAMNTAFMAGNMPTAIMGSDKIDSDIIFPSAVINLDKDSKTAPLLPNINPAALFQALHETEASMEEASISDTAGGQLPPGSTKATASAIAQRQSETMLKAVGKPLAESMVQVGDLMKDIVVNNLSTAQVDDILGDNLKLKYRTLILKDKMVGGKQKDKVLRFDGEMINMKLSASEKTSKNVMLYEESEKKGGHTAIRVLNPQLFARTKYLTRVEPEIMFPRNKEYQQAISTQVYAQFSNNPYISLEALTRKTMYNFYGSETEDLMQNPDTMKNVLGQNQKFPETVAGQQASNTVTGAALAGTGMA